MKNCEVCSVVSEVFRQMNETTEKKQRSTMAQEKPVNDTLKLIKNRKKKPVSGLLLGAELKGQVKIKMVCLGIYCHTLIAQIE